MLDYEIIGYRVTYTTDLGESTYFCGSEPEAIEFIKEFRDRRHWKEYSLTKLQSAIIDF